MFHAMVPGRDEEEAELTRMMDEWGGLVLGLCAVTLKDGHLAQDAAQETFVKAWSHRADWPNLQNRRAWLARIAVNTCRDMQRGGWFRHVTRKQTLDDLSGLIAYVLGRSRRGAFICGVMGVLTADCIVAIVNSAKGVSQTLVLGGAGVFDAAVISGLIGVILAELIGEIAERIVRGSEKPVHSAVRNPVRDKEK